MRYFRQKKYKNVRMLNLNLIFQKVLKFVYKGKIKKKYED